MKFISLFLFISSLAQVWAAEGKLKCDNVIDLANFKGQTYLAFMQETVAPTMNQLATEGYVLSGADAVKKALKNVSSKVGKKAIKSVGGDEEALYSLAQKLEGKTATLYDLPALIGKAAPGSDRYTLSTFFGLVSCGGAIIKYAPLNYAYNIHYGNGENEKDERTGRSFGEGPTRSADDASDKNYLTDLEEFVLENPESMDEFYSTLVKVLGNSDASDYLKIPKSGQTLLTDFLAVYTAEQARNLMDGRISLHWDAALLEVTLLGSFHAGQEQIELFYRNPTDRSIAFVTEVYNQSPGCNPVDTDKVRSARLYDYWQFSASTDRANCNRSGINITKEQFRKLGQAISDYERENNPKLVEKIEKHFEENNRGGNVYQELSNFFINKNAKASLGDSRANQLAKDMTQFLMQVVQDAPAISEGLREE